MTILKLLASEQFWTISKPLARMIANQSAKNKKAGLPILAATLYAEIASAMVSHKSNYIYRTVEKIEDQTHLTDHIQRKCRKVLQEIGVIKVIRKGIPAKLHYLIDEECENKLLDLLRIDNKFLKPLRTRNKQHSRQDSSNLNNIINNTSINNSNNKNTNSEVSPVGITSEDQFLNNQKDTQQRKKVAPKKESDSPQITNLLHQNQLKAMEIISDLVEGREKDWLDILVMNGAGWDEKKFGGLGVELRKFHAFYCSNGNYLTKTKSFINKKLPMWLNRAKHEFKGRNNPNHKIPPQPKNHHQVKALAKKSLEGGYSGEGAW